MTSHLWHGTIRAPIIGLGWRSTHCGVANLLLAFIVLAHVSGVAGADAKSAAPAPAASRPPAAPTSAANFEAFRLITDRNIFDPNRVGRSTEKPPPRTDTIAFVGTMQNDKGLLAFFDSSDRTYRKTLREGQAMGEFKVKRITTDSVELTRDTQQISLHMTEQLRRPEGGDWAVAAPDAPGTTSRATEPASPTDGAVAPAIPPDASETLRRLMERRQKQEKL